MKRTTGSGRRHEDREDLTGEHRLTDIGQLFFAVLFFAVWIADSFALHVTTSVDISRYLAFRIILSAALLTLALYLAVASSRIIFGEKRAKPHVVRRGVFSLVRHPMYESEILFYLGLLVFSTSLASIAVWLATIVFLHRVARTEEALLLDRFGDEYAAYMRDVPMWLPKVSRG